MKLLISIFKQEFEIPHLFFHRKKLLMKFFVFIFLENSFSSSYQLFVTVE